MIMYQYKIGSYKNVNTVVIGSCHIDSYTGNGKGDDDFVATTNDRHVPSRFSGHSFMNMDVCDVEISSSVRMMCN